MDTGKMRFNQSIILVHLDIAEDSLKGIVEPKDITDEFISMSDKYDTKMPLFSWLYGSVAMGLCSKFILS